jgi:hypothetical protein
MGKSIATGLGLAHTDVEILGVNVLQARRLSIVSQPPQQRLLTSSSDSSAHVSVSYQVRTDAAASAGMSASTLSSRMTALGNSSSSSNQRFTETFGPNLQTAATQMGSEGSLLSSVAQEVEGRGVVVIKSETPQTFTIQVVRTDVPIKADDFPHKSVTLILTGIATLVGVCSAFMCAYVLHRKQNEVELVKPLDGAVMDPSWPAPHIAPPPPLPAGEPEAGATFSRIAHEASPGRQQPSAASAHAATHPFEMPTPDAEPLPGAAASSSSSSSASAGPNVPQDDDMYWC